MCVSTVFFIMKGLVNKLDYNDFKNGKGTFCLKL